VSIPPDDPTAAPKAPLTSGQLVFRIVPIAALVVLLLFAKWQLAVVVIVVLFIAIGIAAVRHRRRHKAQDRPV
jgi:membrane protein implicated in regulation of membrane protease activity